MLFQVPHGVHSKRILMDQSSGVDAAEIVVIQAFSVCFHACVSNGEVPVKMC